ncbi:MAG: YceI family protein [Thermoanaerobaculia bacterium]
MKFRTAAALSLMLIASLTACNKSEVDQNRPAYVAEGSAPPPPNPGVGTISTEVIKDQSTIEFVGAKVTRDHKGDFREFEGAIRYDGARPTEINFDIDVASVTTDDLKLTDHLKSEDFFDIVRYPRATFVSTSLTELPAGQEGGATHMLRGNLTMHGVTKEVAFPVKTERTAEGVRATAQFTINRQDWEISYKGMADDLIKDDVLIKLDLRFPPPPETKAAAK